MNFPPSGKRRLFLVLNDLYGSAHIIPFHALGSDKSWISTSQIALLSWTPLEKFIEKRYM